MENGLTPPVALEHTAIPRDPQGRRKRFQDLTKPHVPTLVLDEQGSIRHCTRAARRLLEYRTDQPIDPCFFAHVHGKNLYRVMRDVADIVCYGKSQATWLVRLRTGQRRWRWYRAAVRRHVAQDDHAITIQLNDLHSW